MEKSWSSALFRCSLASFEYPSTLGALYVLCAVCVRVFASAQLFKFFKHQHKVESRSFDWLFTLRSIQQSSCLTHYGVLHFQRRRLPCVTHANNHRLWLLATSNSYCWLTSKTGLGGVTSMTAGPNRIIESISVAFAMTSELVMKA